MKHFYWCAGNRSLLSSENCFSQLFELTNNICVNFGVPNWIWNISTDVLEIGSLLSSENCFKLLKFVWVMFVFLSYLYFNVKIIICVCCIFWNVTFYGRVTDIVALKKKKKSTSQAWYCRTLIFASSRLPVWFFPYMYFILPGSTHNRHHTIVLLLRDWVLN